MKNIMKNNSLSFFEILKYGDKLETKLLKNHIFAIVILISMVIASYFIITNIISAQKDGAKLINISGKQRMFTQKVLTMYYKSYSFSAFDSIVKSFESLDINNKFLIDKLEDKNSLAYKDKYIHNLFFKEDGILQKYKIYKEGIENKKDVEEIYKELFILYDQATSYYENKLTQHVDDLLLYEAIILIISLITIFLEGAFIFRPTILEVYSKHKELKSLNKELNEKVLIQVDTLMKQEQVLIQQAKMAEMGEMLSDISHQWKQPLTILSMQLETIQLDLGENEYSKEQLDLDFEECFKLIGHMHHTIEDFKNFYKPNQEKKEFDIVKAIDEIVKMEKTTLSRHTIDLKVSTDSEKIFINGFESQFKQVVLSIVNNAIEQIVQHFESKKDVQNKGEIKISIKNYNQKVMVKIADNAGGIKDEIIDKVFNPYFSTKGENGGTGIGLYMSKVILEKNFNGSLQVENIDNGATFIISFKIVSN